MSESAKKQRKKVKNHVEYLFNKTKYKIYFITYTFNDDYLKKTKITTRKRKIIELLSDDDIKDYIVNIDFGKENEREHYHAIVAILENSPKIKKDGANKVIFEPYENKKIKEKIGYYNIKECNCESEDKEKLAKYIVKLTQHSIKVKQSYISVKKGSEYQITKKLVKEYVRIDHHSTKPLERRKKDIYVILNSLNDEKNNEMTSKLYNLFDSKLTVTDD